MDISHVQPLLFILLASLFFLPALRAVDFQYCNGIGYDSLNITRVEITWNDETTVTLFGFSSQHIDIGTITVSYKYEGFNPTMKLYQLCGVDACPIKRDANFVITLSKFPLQRPYDDHKFVSDYDVAIALTGEYYDEQKEEDRTIVRMCVYFDPYGRPAPSAAFAA